MEWAFVITNSLCIWAKYNAHALTYTKAIEYNLRSNIVFLGEFSKFSIPWRTKNRTYNNARKALVSGPPSSFRAQVRYERRDRHEIHDIVFGDHNFCGILLQSSAPGVFLQMEGRRRLWAPRRYITSAGLKSRVVEIEHHTFISIDLHVEYVRHIHCLWSVYSILRPMWSVTSSVTDSDLLKSVDWGKAHTLPRLSCRCEHFRLKADVSISASNGGSS